MVDLALSALFWLLLLFMLAAVIAAVRAGWWLLVTPEREAACFAVAASLALSACCSAPAPKSHLDHIFYHGDVDQHHADWRKRAGSPL